MNKNSILKNIFENNIFPVIFAVIIISALILRTYLYKNYTAGFYCDECFLVLNIQNGNFLNYFFPLQYEQCCPPLFLCLAKIIYSQQGLNEHFLRFIPYLSSILSVFTFAILTFLSLKNRISILFANTIFAISYPLLTYTYLFKHYSIDVLTTNVVLITVFLLKYKKISYKNLFILGITSAVMVFASYTSGFIIISSAFSLYICQYYLNRKYHFNKKRLFIFLKSLLFFIIPFGIIMLFYFFINCLPAIQNKFLQIYWHINEPYEIFKPQSIKDIFNLFEYLTLGLDSVKPVIIGLFIITSEIFSLLKNKFFFLITFLPFVFAGIFAIFDLYPFAPDRVSLYLTPIFILIISKIFDYTCRNIQTTILSALLTLTIFNYSNIKNNISDLIERIDFQALSMTKPFIQELYKTDYTKEDYIWGDYASFCCFEVYDTENRINKKNIIIGWNLAKNEKEMSQLPVNSNIFFFLSDKNQKLSKFNEDAKILINKNCDIIYSQNNRYGTIIKCKKIVTSSNTEI